MGMFHYVQCDICGRKRNTRHDDDLVGFSHIQSGQLLVIPTAPSGTNNFDVCPECCFKAFQMLLSTVSSDASIDKFLSTAQLSTATRNAILRHRCTNIDDIIKLTDESSRVYLIGAMRKQEILTALKQFGVQLPSSGENK